MEWGDTTYHEFFIRTKLRKGTPKRSTKGYLFAIIGLLIKYERVT